MFEAIKERDIEKLGEVITEAFRAQTSIFPAMLINEILEKIREIGPNVKGFKVNGAGGGGYLIVVTDTLDTTVMEKIQIRNN